ncbi:MAG: metallophosphoesterase [Planctomycetes bacterium]|nr:metallophosphoesterase [Planctomycetota bacterium]
MRIAWASDVHFDFVEREDVVAWCQEIAGAGAEALLLGGDIADARSLEDWLDLVREQLSPRPVYFVLGNHDYYHGSIADVRAMAGASRAEWLANAGPVYLDEQTALVGVGGWGDARVGNFIESPVTLNDYVLIKELAVAKLDRSLLQPLLEAEGEREASVLRGPLQAALMARERVLVLTHVPPFRAACWHEGQTSNDDWAPGFVCGATGALLLAEAAAHPDRELTVFCGHTHSPGWARSAPNLVTHTLGAEYGAPAFAVFETEGLGSFSPPGAPPRE